jgi:pimeloyl-ACP methyl ester carboxylesterase
MLIVQARTGAVVYEEQGTGTPLVLLHANPGDLHHFDGIIATLARSYRTIALDWPGYGQSTIAHAQLVVLPTGHEPFAEDPEAFLQVLVPFLQVVSVQRNFHGTSDSSSAD